MKKQLAIYLYSIILLFILCPLKTSGQCDDIDIRSLKKIAIVIGQSEYRNAKVLKNAANDATDIAAALELIDFKVYKYIDVDKKRMSLNIDDWCEKIKNYDIVLFYYAGHGAEVDRENFLFGIDANPIHPTDLVNEGFSATKLLNRIDSTGSKYNIFILDACRNNPFKIDWGRTFINKDGLSEMVGNSTFVAFSASPQKKASDGEGRNSPFTEGILKYITVPNLNIDELFTKVNNYVRLKTAGKQIPWKNSSIGILLCLSTPEQEIKEQSKIEIEELKSGSVLTADTKNRIGYLANIDSSVISIIELPSLKHLKKLRIQGIIPNLILPKSSAELYILDSTNKKALLYNMNQKSVKREFKFESTPICLLATKEFLYIIEKGNFYRGIINIIDLTNFKIKQITIPGLPISAVINKVNGILYISSKPSPSETNLIKFDLRTSSYRSDLKSISGGLGIQLSPNNKTLLASSELNNNYVTFLNLETDTVISKLDGMSPTRFEYSQDGKYIYALGNKEMYVIDSKKFQILDVIAFASQPQDFFFFNSKEAAVWLPQENYLYRLLLKDSFFAATPNLNLEDFQFEKLISEIEMQRKKINIDSLEKIVESTFQVFFGFVQEITLQSNGMLRSSNFDNEFNEKTISLSKDVMISRTTSTNKSLLVNCTFHLENSKVIISIEDGKQINNLLSYDLILGNTQEIRKFVRSYFIPRAKELIDKN